TTTTTLSQPYAYHDWKARVHPDDLKRIEAERRFCLEARMEYEGEYRVVWPDGSQHWVASRGVFHYDNEGKPARMLGIVIDISKRKRTEEALARSRAELEQRVEERTAEDRKSTRLNSSHAWM